MPNIFGRRFKLQIPQLVVLGFAALILLGSLVLMLPVCTADGSRTPFIDSLFTATTSVCVTGLVVRDTGSYWSDFGHAVILLLIQVGGLGIITIGASFAMLAGRKIGLYQRNAMQENIGSQQGGIVKLTGFLVKTALAIELIGAILLCPVLIKDFGWSRGIWTSIFTSISAFCNAGIDLFGIREAYSSLTGYADNILVNVTVMVLIVVAGLGFLTWDDMRTHGFRFRKYRMQSKVILVTSALLIFIPAVLFFFFEFDCLPMKQRILASLFQSITTRTAGMNTMDLDAMSESGKMMMIFLMLIGGSPGSTAGGMKTTTFAVLVACAIAVFRKRDSAQFFGRRIGHDVVATAATLLTMYVTLCVGGAMIISLYESLPMLTCLYETASAVATVGLTLGITPTLGLLSKIILIILMYMGRVGGLTLIYAAISPKKQMGKLPLDKITVG